MFNVPNFAMNPSVERQLHENFVNKQLQNDIAKCNTAEVIAEKLYEAVTNYQSRLANTEDVALQLVQFGNQSTIIVENIGYIDYSLVVFEGKDSNGNRLELIQHISQLNFLIIAVPRKPMEQPAELTEPEVSHRKIGFVANWTD